MSDFFLYYEDVDLCRRVRQAEWSVVHFAGAQAEHAGGGTNARSSSRNSCFWNSFSFSQSGIAMRNEKSPWEQREIGFEQAFELEKRLVIERDVIRFAKADAAFVQTICECVVGKAGIVLLAREALLLGGRNDVSVDHERRCCSDAISGPLHEAWNERG
jgi:hypothetical protein